MKKYTTDIETIYTIKFKDKKEIIDELNKVESTTKSAAKR
jgi:hypothetical protein